MAATRERLDAIRVVLEAAHVIPSTRVAAIIFLLYGTPIGRIVALQADAITSAVDGMTIELGNQPAPVPESLIPLFNEHLNGVGSRSMNKDSSWLFPSTKPGQHISANTLWNRLKIFGIQPQPTRNTTLFNLTKELDASTLGAPLGYSAKVMANHSARTGNAMASYPATKRQQL
ncbi:hypothetical protein [Microbacterium sp. LWH10-1.2]|uniref:hypothetical protein n=1 Tax=Microbacterium sp. LWH10-1.2 TaxID=3135255 RepID=UPI003138802A